MIELLDGQQFKDMIIGAAATLEKNKDALDALNVFPVPDGDTGTNMSLTMISAAKEVAAADPMDMKAIVQALSLGALKGARGNSGVILSQLLRGFTKIIRSRNIRWKVAGKSRLAQARRSQLLSDVQPYSVWCLV